MVATRSTVRVAIAGLWVTVVSYLPKVHPDASSAASFWRSSGPETLNSELWSPPSQFF